MSLVQFARLTTESAATLSRRKQHKARLPGPTAVLILVLDYLYELWTGPEQENVGDR